MFSPKEIANNYIGIGAGKTKNTILCILILGVFGGMFTGFAGVAATVASATVTNGSLSRLLQGAMFPFGLIGSLIAGGEVFVGGALLLAPLAHREARFPAVMKTLIIVWIGNFIGASLVSALTVGGGTYSLFSNQAAVHAISLAVSKANMTFFMAFFRGIMCGFLVCIGVWVAFAAKDVAGKIIGLYMPIMMFVLCSFSNVVADMYYITCGLFLKAGGNYAAIAEESGVAVSTLTWSAMFANNMLPVTLGNFVGGGVIVGLGYWLVYTRREKRQGTPA
ncbi:MAG: formate/nitrite transporter family protein [Oscillospiraceae bacterium]|nr:formate/nitrite transporter family protein [Oscillospiraceae bacterium]